MMKHAAYIILLFILLSNGNAQSNLHTLAGYRGSVSAARYLASTHQLTESRFEVNLNYNLWVANKSLSYGSIMDISRNNRLTSEDVESIISELDDNNRIGVGQDLLIVGLGLKTTIKNHPVTWNFTIADRFNTNVLIPKTLFQLLWQGNKQFEGQTVDISQTTMTGLYFRDFALGFATPLLEWDNWKSRVGLRLSYYQGLAGLSNPQNQFYFTTAPGAEYLDLDYNFDFRYTGIDDFSLFETRGHGFGLSLGTTFTYKEALNFDIALTDIGKIHFNRSVYRLGEDNEFQFHGLGLDELINPQAYLDSLERIFTPTIDSLGDYSFAVKMGMRFSFMTSWTFGKELRRRGPMTLSLLYSQGFSEQPGSTLSPEFSLMFHTRILRHLVLGTNVTLGGFNNVAVGLQAGMHFKTFRFSLFSDNFTGFIFPDQATGAAGGLMLQFYFGQER
jgi:hypothetical protein